jgi:hypothetical protein
LAIEFLFSTVSRPALGPTQPPIEGILGALSLGVNLTTHLHLSKEYMVLYLHSSIHPHGMLNLSTETSSFFKISATVCCGVYKERSHIVGKNRYFCLFMMIFSYSDKGCGSSEIINATVILADKPQ